MARYKIKLSKNSRKNLRRIITNYRLLKTSWNVQTKVFFENSTLHGVRYIAEVGRPFIEKFIWFVCVAIGAVATIVIIVSLWEKFQTNPTITGLDTDFHNWDVPFPALTVCQMEPSNLTTIREYLENNGTYTEELEEFLFDLTKLTLNTIPEFVAKYNNNPNIPNLSNIISIIYPLMNECNEVFGRCDFKSNKVNCCKRFFPVFTESGFCYTFNSRFYEKYHPETGAAYPEFNIHYIKETDLKWSLKFEVRGNWSDFPIYILNSDERVGIDVQPQHVWNFKVDSISFSVRQTYTTEDTRQLSIKQRHCTFADEVKLKIDNIYTYTACTRQCRMDTAMEKCKCVPHFYSDVKEPYQHCSFRKLKCISDHLEEIKSVDKCSCNLGCSNTVYEVEKLSDPGMIVLSMEAEFVSWPMVRYKREVLFGWVDLLVSFGGIAGLFLGFSLLSGVEIIYYFTVRAICMVNRDKSELIRIQKENANKRAPDYDLSLIPYFVRKPLPGNGTNEIARRKIQRMYHKNIRRQKIVSVQPQGKTKQTEKVWAPFGIEFVN